MDAVSSMNVRVRFAPSPTGFLHIGGARTALFNWLYARHTGGTFILRIEDTDTARNTQEAVEVILQGLRWLGLDWDEGPVDGQATHLGRGDRGPYFQSQRADVYRKWVQYLLERNLAYEADGATKFRMTREPIVFEDLAIGAIRRELTDREALDPDFVIVRSDGQPVFHLVNVIDDLEMGITHVVRGEDHISNTAKHIALFRAFGVEPPRYAHIPLILNPDGTKMSKRDQGASLATYIEEGYLPEAVVNYLVLLGWSPKDNREILPIEDVIGRFDLPQIQRHNARFDLKKLQWLNVAYLHQLSGDRFTALASQALERAGVSLAPFPKDYIAAAVSLAREKIKTLTDLPPFVDFFFVDEVALDPEAMARELTPASRDHLAALRGALVALDPFTAAAIEAALKTTAAARSVKNAVLVHPARVACTGKTIGPSLYHLMEVLGRERVLRRFDRALAQIADS